MSMPEFPKSEDILNREESLNAILTSIAMEETALSHVINAESEKIKYATERVKCGCSCEDIETLLEINESAASLIEQITDMQIILKNKLKIVADHLPFEDKKPCPNPKLCIPQCCKLQCSKCTSVFSAKSELTWFSGTSLCAKEISCCENGIKLCKSQFGPVILLPARRKYKIDLYLKLSKNSSCPVSISAEFHCGCNIVNSKKLSNNLGEKNVHMSVTLFWEAMPLNKKSFFALRLNSPEKLKVIKGIIEITECK